MPDILRSTTKINTYLQHHKVKCTGNKGSSESIKREIRDKFTIELTFEYITFMTNFKTAEEEDKDNRRVRKFIIIT